MQQPLEQDPTSPVMVEYPDGIFSVDTVHLRHGLAASHLVVAGGRAAFVDTGANNAAPLLLAALERQGLSPADVDYLLLTHVHLDHAGGAGLLMESLPNATAVLHPRGARHMIDPARLEAGARAVYGDAKFEAVYGGIHPIPAERVHVVEDGDVLELGGRQLECLHTEGHARHHYCIYDRDARVVFTGDTFGLSYRALDTDKGEFILPTTTPVQFDPPALHASIDRLMSYRPAAAYLTHYSRVSDLTRLAADLHADIDAYTELAAAAAGRPDAARLIEDGVRERLYRRLDDHGCPADPAWRERHLALDIGLNTQGILVWLERSAKQG
jgi:glyoxylase-like metal-dependent hydrolase (beta-lactamase superfamily II)